MFFSSRIRLTAIALVAAATLPLVPWTGTTVADESREQQSPCGCGGDAAENDAGPFRIVEFLYPRWSAEGLREGEDVAVVYADLAGLQQDFYMLRVYASGEKAFASLVDRRGAEFPFAATFAFAGKRGVAISLDFWSEPDDGSTQNSSGGGSGPAPSGLEMNLTCGSSEWVTIEWTNDDGTTEYYAECFDGL